jgi:iron complex transport system ATP-binding protein
MLQADSLYLTLSSRPVLQGVNASFERGKVSIILGPNGAGKSSLLSCLATLRSPDQGSVTLDKTLIINIPPLERARKIGLLPQSADVHWDIQARALVALGRYPHQGRGALSASDTAAIDAAMLATDTVQFTDRNVMMLSGGERARVLLARVLAGQPDWILADEPLANLDPGHQVDILNVLRKQAETGAGVVAVLHDLNHAARIADHIILMKDSRVFASGTPRDVLTQSNLVDVYGIECTVTCNAATAISITITGRSND